MTNELNNLNVALDALSKGIAPIPCYPGKKVPMERWLRWQNELPPEALVRVWFRDPRVNIAVICTGAVVFDVDNPELLDLVIRECGDTPEKVRTPSGGFHLPNRARMGVVLQNQVKIKGLAIDCRTNGGLRVIPPSETPAGKYEWIEGELTPIAELPVAKIGWTRERKRTKVHSVIEPLEEQDAMVRRAWAWAATVEGAISGQHGHNKFYRFVCKILHRPPHGFGLSLLQALPIIDQYNLTCEPEFSERERDHKIADALKNPRASQ